MAAAEVKRWQTRTFSLLWVSYASYYLCRMNFAVAQPAILDELPSLTKADVGLIPSVYAVSYAAGQFINGQLGSRFGARRMMTAGLAVIALANVAYAFTSSYFLMLVLWTINGYCQAIGWPMIAETMSHFFRVARRGTMMGLISTSYQGGNVLAWLLSGWLVTRFGWRAAFFVPGLALLPVALACAIGLRNRPEDVGLERIRDDIAPDAAAGNEAHWSIGRIMKVTLSSRVLWILAISYFCFNAVRYAFMNWSVQYFKDVHGQDIKNSALRAVAFPLIGAGGALAAGWLSDHVFGSRRAPVCTLMLGLLALLCVGFIPIRAGDTLMATVVLAAAGFMVYGPDAILTGAAPIDLSHPKTAASATGFIMATGNLGSAVVSGLGVGLLLDRFGGSFGPVFMVLAALSALSAAAAALLWNARAKSFASRPPTDRIEP